MAGPGAALMPPLPIWAILPPRDGEEDDGVNPLAEPAEAARMDSFVGLPLCVDMDGTLLRIDALHEAVVAAVSRDWRVLFRLPIWLAEGKVRLKQEVARRWVFDPAGLPYNPALLAYLRAQRAGGRHLVLCTAAPREIAGRIAAHLGLFDEVMASEGAVNLRGTVKAETLCRRFGRGGFVYAGNDASDLAVWDCAAAAMVVNAPASVQRAARARCPVLTVIDDRPAVARAALRAMRPYQWVKNLLCLVPPIAASDFTNAGSWARTLTIVLAFCLAASGTYLLNDILDVTADRAHPRKSHRPFASGDLPVAVGLVLCPVLLLGGAACGWAGGALVAVAVYLALSLAYSLRLKELPVIDVFVLAGLYTIRLFGGGEASGHPVSQWLLGFSSFLFLSLAVIKRVSELQRLPAADHGHRPPRRGYRPEDVGMLQMQGCAATFASAIVLSLYVQSETVSRVYSHPAMLWGSVPLLLFWQCRLWLSTSRGYMHDDPIIYAARDWVSWTVFACLVVLVAAATGLRLPS